MGCLGFGPPFGINLQSLLDLGAADQLFQQVEQTAAVAIGCVDEQGLCFVRQIETGMFRQGENFGAQTVQIGGGQGGEGVSLGAAE